MLPNSFIRFQIKNKIKIKKKTLKKIQNSKNPIQILKEIGKIHEIYLEKKKKKKNPETIILQSNSNFNPETEPQPPTITIIKLLTFFT